MPRNREYDSNNYSAYCTIYNRGCGPVGKIVASGRFGVRIPAATDLHCKSYKQVVTV